MVYWLISTFQKLLNLLPLSWRNAIFASLMRFLLMVKPKLKHTAKVNLRLALPETTDAEHEELINKCCDSWGRTIADIFRQKDLDNDWLENHIEFPKIQEFREFKAKYADRGCLFLTPHYGSFELFLKYYEQHFGGIAFIARKIKPVGFERWWTEQRKSSAHQLISRQGAIQQVLQCLAEGQDVGLLPDHNLVRNQAVFVNWFGHYAANTPLVAIAAIKYRTPVILATVEPKEQDKYCINTVLYDPDQIYPKDLVQNARSIYYYTEFFASTLQALIMRAPEHWLWFHKRWKTSIKTGEGERIYA